MLIDTMAEKYKMLPSEVCERGTTLDIQFHIHAEKYKDRERKKASGQDISSTYTQSEIQEVYKQWRKTDTV